MKKAIVINNKIYDVYHYYSLFAVDINTYIVTENNGIVKISTFGVEYIYINDGNKYFIINNKLYYNIHDGKMLKLNNIYLYQAHVNYKIIYKKIICKLEKI